MILLQNLALGALTVTFMFRFRLLFQSRDGRQTFFSRKGVYPWLACGLGALAILTQGTILPQSVLDAPLGGSNVLKLLQDMLTVAAFTLLVWNAIDVSAAEKPTRSTVVWRWTLLGAMQAALVLSFATITGRGATDYYFVEANQDRLDVWLFGSVYILEMLLVSALLLGAIRGRRAAPYRWFRVGCYLVIAACVAELLDLSSSQIPALSHLTGLGRAIFDPLFYSGVLAIVATLAFFTTTPWRRRLELRRRYRALDKMRETHGVPLSAEPRKVEGSDLAQLATVVRDAHIGQAAAFSNAELAYLNEVEDYLERQFGASLDLGDARVTVVNAEA